MTRRLTRPVLLVLAAGALAVAAAPAAADDFFMQIDGASGGSPDAQYPNASPLDYFSWSLTNPTPPGATTASKAKWDVFRISKRVDAVSTYLLLHADSGARIPSIRIVARKTGAQPLSYLQYCLEDVVVGSYDLSGSILEEHVGFTPGRVEMRFVRQKSDGSPLPSLLTGWSIVSNTSVGFNNACGGMNTR